MTPSQQAALEGLTGRPLTADEIAAIGPYLAGRNDVAVAAVLSAGRVRYQTKMISERGVRAALSITAGSALMRLFKDAADQTAAGTIPSWLPPVLTAAGIPAEAHQDYADAIGSAHGWLLQDAGLDIGSQASRQMLDLIAMSDPAKYGATVATIKGLAAVADPINYNAVSDALNVAEGRN